MMHFVLICFKNCLLMEEKHLMIQKSTCTVWVYLHKCKSVKKAVKSPREHFRVTYVNRLLLYLAEQTCLTQ